MDKVYMQWIGDSGTVARITRRLSVATEFSHWILRLRSGWHNHKRWSRNGVRDDNAGEESAHFPSSMPRIPFHTPQNFLLLFLTQSNRKLSCILTTWRNRTEFIAFRPWRSSWGQNIFQIVPSITQIICNNKDALKQTRAVIFQKPTRRGTRRLRCSIRSSKRNVSSSRSQTWTICSGIFRRSSHHTQRTFRITTRWW